jgi:LPXTG-motif cell wall-anchored protein
VPTTFTLPETGSSLTLAVTAACVSALGLFFVLARRSRGGES